MNQDLFMYLPSQIIIEIISRLHIRTIISCKCVCKSWHGLLETDEFVKYHLSKAVPGVAVEHHFKSSLMHRIFEFEDGNCNPVTKVCLPISGCMSMNSSVNGLLCIGTYSLHISNPITREYINLHSPQKGMQSVALGFGTSKRNEQYKVVMISQNHGPLSLKTMCHVYTLGTGSWRIVEPSVSLLYQHHRDGAFLNGNLHWLADVNDSEHCVSCFDLETELFSMFSPPPIPFPPPRKWVFYGVCSLKGCLCLCDSSSVDEIAIWLMMEYGVEKSWTREFVVSKGPGFNSSAYRGWGEFVKPIKAFKNGDVLMMLEHYCLYYYSEEKNTLQIVDLCEGDTEIKAMVHTPSFLSLKSFEMENVGSI